MEVSHSSLSTTQIHIVWAISYDSPLIIKDVQFHWL